MIKRKKTFYYNLDWLPNPIWTVVHKLVARPFIWAHHKRKQTLLTRFIRATYRAL